MAISTNPELNKMKRAMKSNETKASTELSTVMSGKQIKKMQLKDGAEPFEQLRQEACYFFKKLEAA